MTHEQIALELTKIAFPAHKLEKPSDHTEVTSVIHKMYQDLLQKLNEQTRNTPKPSV